MWRRYIAIPISAAFLMVACSAPNQTPTTPAPTTLPGIGGMPTTVLPTIAAAAPTSVTERERATYTVQRGEVIDQVILSGQVVPVQQALTFMEDGIIKSIPIERGAKVKRGDLLAELDLGDLTNQLQQARAIYEQDRLALDQATQAGQIEVRQAQVDLDEAKARLEELGQPATPEKLAAARAKLEQAQAALETVRNDASAEKNQAQRELDTAVKGLTLAQERYAIAFDKYQATGDDQEREMLDRARDDLRLAEDAVNKARIAYDTARGNEVAAVKSATADVSVAQAELNLLQRGPDKFRVAEMQRQVDRAAIALDAARQRAAPDPELAKRVAAGEADLQRVEQQIDARRLYAPFDGEISMIEARAGVAVRANSPVMVIVDPAKYEVMAELEQNADQPANPRLVVGQKVQLSFPRHSGTIFEGVVTRQPGRSSDGSAGIDSAYYVSYNPQGAAFDIGDMADVSVLLGRAENVLWLPTQAVRFNRDRPFVMVMDGDSERKVDITIGLQTPERIEIVSGLEEQAEVLGDGFALR